MGSKSQNWSEGADQTIPINERILNWIFAQARWAQELLIYSSAYLALIAIIKVIIVIEVLSLSSSPAPIVVGLITFTIYANDRLADLETDAASNPRRAAFVRQHRNSLYVLAALSYGLAVAIATLGGPLAFGLALLPGVAWILYALDWMPGSMSFQRLKEVLLVNTAVVATAWALTVVFLPLAFADATLTPTVGIVFSYFFLGTFVNTEIANVRDIESDRQTGVSTLPTVLGVYRTRQALYGVVLLMTAILGYAMIGGYLTATVVAVLLIGPAYLLGVIALLGRTSEDILTVAAECSRVPVFVILMLVVA